MKQNFTVGQIVRIANASSGWASSYGQVERVDGRRIYVRVAVDRSNPTVQDTIQFGAGELRQDNRK